MIVFGELNTQNPGHLREDGKATVHLLLKPVRDAAVLTGALATFGIDAGIMDAPGHVVATILRACDGSIQGLKLEPI
jgi:hypothetical protein